MSPLSSEVKGPDPLLAVQKPKRKKRRPYQYQNVSLGRRPTPLEQRLLSLAEIPRQLDSHVAHLLDVLPTVRRQPFADLMSLCWDYIRQVAAYGSFEHQQEWRRQGVVLDLDARYHVDRILPRLDQDVAFRRFVQECATTIRSVPPGSRDVKRSVRGLVNRAFATGRTYERQRLIALKAVEPELLVLSAILDSHTCDVCYDLDGTEFEEGSPEEQLYAVPLNQCESAASGTSLCRCQVIAIGSEPGWVNAAIEHLEILHLRRDAWEAADVDLADTAHPLTPEDRSDIAKRAWDTRGRHDDVTETERVTPTTALPPYPTVTISQPDHFTNDEARAVGLWTSTSSDLNTVLRTGKPQHGDTHTVDEHLHDAAVLDTLIEKSALQESVTLFRSIPAKHIATLQPGTVISDKGFVSLTGAYFVAAELSQRVNGVVIQVQVPKGHHLLDVDRTGLSLAEMTEFEFLLARNQRFRVVSNTPEAIVVRVESPAPTFANATIMFAGDDEAVDLYDAHPLTPDERSAIAKQAWVTRGARPPGACTPDDARDICKAAERVKSQQRARATAFEPNKLKALARSTTRPYETRLILPDGTRLKGEGEHRHLVAPYTLEDVLDAGVLRYQPGSGVHTRGVITDVQAQMVADDWNYEYVGKPLYVDAGQPGTSAFDEGHIDAKRFDPPIQADALRRWINSHYGPDATTPFHAVDVVIRDAYRAYLRNLADPHPLTPDERSAIAVRAWESRGRATKEEARRAAVEKQYQEHLRTEPPIVRYHGTMDEAVAGILRDGLVPAKGLGGDAWAHFQIGGGREASVFFTDNEPIAMMFGRLAAEVNPGARPVVIELNIPYAEYQKRQTKSIQTDEASEFDAGINQRHVGAIPKEWVKRVGDVTCDPTAPPVDWNPREHCRIAWRLRTDPSTVTVYGVFLLDESPADVSLSAAYDRVVRLACRFNAAAETQPLTAEERSAIAERAWDTRGRGRAPSQGPYRAPPATTIAVTDQPDLVLTQALAGDLSIPKDALLSPEDRHRIRTEEMIPATLTTLNWASYQDIVRVKQEVAEKLRTRLAHNVAFQAMASDPEILRLVKDSRNRGEGVDAVVPLLIHQWAETSADHHPMSIAIQRAVQDELDLTDAPNDHLLHAGKPPHYMKPDEVVAAFAESERLYQKFGPALRAFARAQYVETQEFLKAHGIAEMTVYRGVRSVHGSTKEFFDKHLHAIKNAPHAVPISLQPVSSFSLDLTTAARGFGSLMTVAIRVPAAQIFSTFRTGVGSLMEGEITVLGGRYLALGHASHLSDYAWPSSTPPLAAAKFAEAGRKLAKHVHMQADEPGILTDTLFLDDLVNGDWIKLVAQARGHDLATALTPDERSEIARRAWDTRGRARSDRSKRAARTAKPSKAWKQRIAKQNEAAVAEMLHGTQTDDNAPADVLLDIDETLHGIEVKTLVENDNSKVTCHPDSCERKRQWAKKHRAVLHQVVIDDRPKSGGWSGWRLYYRRGVGSPRVPGRLIKITSAAHLKRLMAAPL